MWNPSSPLHYVILYLWPRCTLLVLGEGPLCVVLLRTSCTSVRHSNWASAFWFLGVPARKLLSLKKKKRLLSLPPVVLHKAEITFYVLIWSSQTLQCHLNSLVLGTDQLETEKEFGTISRYWNNPGPRCQWLSSEVLFFLLQILIQMRVFCKWFFFSRNHLTYQNSYVTSVWILKKTKQNFYIKPMLCKAYRLHMQVWKLNSCGRNQEVYLCYIFLIGKKKVLNK